MSKVKASAQVPIELPEQLVSDSDAITVLRTEKLGSEVPLSDEEQFINAVTRFLQGWLDHADDVDLKKSRPSLFLFARDVDAEDFLEDLELAPSFRKLLDQDLEGHVHACSLGLRKVARKAVAVKDASAALKWATKHAGGDVTAVVFVPKMRRAMIKRSSDDADDCETREFGHAAGTVFNFSMVEALLDRFHADWTKSHLGHCRIWAVPKERKLNPNAEAQIQGCLHGYFDLTIRPRGVVVDEEFYTQLGRGDVRLIKWKLDGSNASNGQVEACILELKVLRPDRSKNNNVKWALSGIQQALDYREAQKYPGPSYLCCFDGRKEDAAMPTVEARAKKTGVVSKRFFMKTPGCA